MTLHLEVRAIRLRSDVSVSESGGVLLMTSRVGCFRVRGLTARSMELLHQIVRERLTLDYLVGQADASEASKLTELFARIRDIVVHGLVVSGQVLLEIETTAHGARYDVKDVDKDATVRLSRFSFLRMSDQALVLECPLSMHRARLCSEAAGAIVIHLAAPTTPADLAGELPVSVVSDLLGHLAGTGLVELGGLKTDSHTSSNARFWSDTHPPLRQWDFHDLLLHSRARSGRSDQPFGGIYPFRGSLQPQPAIKPVPRGSRIQLSRPNLNVILQRDPHLATAMEARKSVREYGREPITAEHLGEFLYRSARVRSFTPRIGDDFYDTTSRPYPSGGASYELELYVTVSRCCGIRSACYYYDPVDHALVLVNEEKASRKAMLEVAARASGLGRYPDVLITITSRFERLSWKYRSIAYSTCLRNTGVLYQSMYLVATAMGLAPCALGSGDSDLAARVLHLDYICESSVGDFMLGTMPRTPAETQSEWEDTRKVPINDPAWEKSARAELSRLGGRSQALSVCEPAAWGALAHHP